MNPNLNTTKLIFLYVLIGILSLVHQNSYGQSINFNQSSLDFKNFSPISNGTSLNFGPDERLYVAQLNGEIKIYTIIQTGPNNYEVISQETLQGVKQIPNHDDNGQPAFDNRSNRQITGITVVGTATNPIIYAGSSDPKWGGPSGDKMLDTNSGIITKLTWTGSNWDVVDLVRGLPRSEENHSINGLEFTTINGKPYLLAASGGFTNAGAPSKNFAYITEYALSGAILSIDLEAIEAMPIKTDTKSGRKYKYDIPTLDDPSRPNVNNVYDPNHPSYDGIDVGDPFGGNDGLNMAMIVEGGPVQIFSPGYRNAYDFVVTESKKVYVTDNGANNGWGGLPEFEADPFKVNNNYLPTEPGGSAANPSPSGEYVDNKDHLLMITTNIDNYNFGSFYGGHPTPIRANPGSKYQAGFGFPYNPGGAGLYTKFIGDDDNYKNITPAFTPTDKFRTEILQPIPPGATGFNNYAANSLPANWPPVPLSMANGAESDFIAPSLPNPNGPQPDIVTLLPVNSNGIDEYKASNFGGTMKGSLIIGQSSGNLHLVNLNANGSFKSAEFGKWNLNGGNALGISCNGDGQIFPGTIWVATLDNRIMVLTPGDYILCIDQNDPKFDPLADYDGDGYTNQDEIDNGTDYCSGASIPNDYDKDFVSDLNDLDDDGDGILDEDDPFQLGDPRNLPINNELFSNQLDNKGRQSGYLGLGLTGFMNNGAPNPNWLNWLDKPDERPGERDIYGGAAGAIQVAMVGGTANGISNNQEKGFQFGVNVGKETGKFIITSGLIGLTSSGQIYDFDGNGEIGIQMGDGTQSNFIKLVVTKNHIMAAQEIDDIPDTNPLIKTISIEQRPSNQQMVELIFEVDPVGGTIEPFYKFGNEPQISLGIINSAGKIAQAIQEIQTPLAIGIYGTTNDYTKSFYGVWDYFRVTGAQPYIIRQLKDIEKNISDPDQIIDLGEYFDDNAGKENLIFKVQNNTNPTIGASIQGTLLKLTFPSTEATSNITIRATDADGLFVEQSFTVTVLPAKKIFLRINAGGAILNDATENPDWLGNNTNGSISNATYSVNTGSVASHSFSSANRHSSIPSYITDQMYTQIFGTERYSTVTSMQFDIPLTNGDYLVNLYMGNGYDGTSGTGQRVFNVAIEGVTRISQLDLSAKYGHKVGAMEQFPVTLTDGVLNINFIKGIENPLINAIEIVKVSTALIHNPIIFTPLPDQINYPGDQLDGSLLVEASGGDGNLNFSAIGLPPGILIEPTNGVIYGKVSENAAGNSPYQVTITIDDEDGTTTDAVSFNFTWTISPLLTDQTWKIKNESQAYTARHENSFVQAGNKFYLMGGRESAKTIDIYDYENDTWRSLSNSSPFDFNHFQAVEYQGLIWVIGAFKNNSFPTEAPADHVWAFDPAKEEWIQGPAIPDGRKRGSAGLVMFNNKFYLVNGNTAGHNGGYVNYFDEFDPHTGVWTILQNSPRPRDHFFSTVIGNEMYVASGRLSGGDGGTFGPVIPEVDVYNFSTKTWRTLPADKNLPTPRAGAILNNYLNKIVIAGGEVPDSSVALKITEVYDPVLNEWTLSNPMNFARHGTQGIVSGKGLYVLAGSPNQGGGNQKNMEVYGFDEPHGTPLVSSELITPTSLTVKPNEVTGTILNVKNGNTGIFIKSLSITGPDASDFVIQKGLTEDFLVNANSDYEIEIFYSGTKENPNASIEIRYGTAGLKTINLIVGAQEPNNPPTVVNPIPDQTANVSIPYSFTFDINTFSDPDGDVLTYSASREDGTPLPNWLFFNANTRTFSGTPSEFYIGPTTILVTASDGKGGTVVDSFILTVVGEPTSPAVAIRINSGGSQFTTGSGSVFSADQSFSGGTTYTNNNIATISGTSDDDLYKSERYGNFSYNVNVSSGTYLVRLHFAEIYFGATGGGPGGAGNRVFNVTAEGQNLLTNFDIFAEVGSMTALIKEFDVSVNDGTLNLAFITVQDNAKVSAIEIISKTTVNSPPVVQNPIPNQNATVGTAFNFIFAENTFSDPDGDVLTYSATQANGSALPSWLSFNASNRTFSGTPGTADVGTVSIKVTADDGKGSTVSDDFNLTVVDSTPVNQPPVLQNPIPDQNAIVGTTFNFTFADNTFSDPDGDVLTYSATQANGSALPSWLSFNTSNRTFSGTPGTVDVGTVSIRVTADDGKGGSVSDDFNLTVVDSTPVNQPPVLQNPIPDQNATVGTTFNFTFADNTFIDPDGDVLTYSASQANGSALPSWLSFNASNRTFSGTPGTADVGTVSIRVTADDGKGGTVSDDFNLTVVDSTPANQPPVVQNPIPDQNATVGTAFNFTFADNTFSDPDGDVLTYVATLANGSALPSWLTFNASIKTFNGTPATADGGTISIRVTANDGKGGTVSDDFNLTVVDSTPVNQPPVVQNPIPDQNTTVGTAFNFTFAENTFSDPDGDVLTYSATQANGSAIPSWLSFNASNRTFSGTPGTADVGTVIIRVTADDGKGGTVSDDFNLTVVDNTPVNQPPVVQNPIPDQNATIGTAFNFTFAENTFSDPDGDVLTYSATQANGSALPSWLNFNASTRTFSGIPGTADVGTNTIRVTANDGKDGTVSDDFNLTVINVVETAIRINSGGPNLSAFGETFVADQYFSGGKTKNYGRNTQISGTTQPELYRTERNENFSYNIPVPSGTYLVKLHFVELTFVRQRAGVGRRIFNVTAENSPLLTNFDISTEVSSSTALVKEFEIQVTDGVLNLDFIGVVDVPTLSALEVLSNTDTKSLIMENARILNSDQKDQLEVQSSNNMDEHIKVYPNPFDSYINISVNAEEKQEYVVRIYDLLGKLHFTDVFKSDASGVQTITLNLSSKTLKPGSMYLVLVESKSGSYQKSFKMIKK